MFREGSRRTHQIPKRVSLGSLCWAGFAGETLKEYKAGVSSKVKVLCRREGSNSYHELQLPASMTSNDKTEECELRYAK